MDITPQEQAMLQAFRETGLPPLFVLIRVRNDIANDSGNITDDHRDRIVQILEQYIGPQWESYHESKKSLD